MASALKKLLGTSASLLVTSALVVTMFATSSKKLLQTPNSRPRDSHDGHVLAGRVPIPRYVPSLMHSKGFPIYKSIKHV